MGGMVGVIMPPDTNRAVGVLADIPVRVDGAQIAPASSTVAVGAAVVAAVGGKVLPEGRHRLHVIFKGS